MNANKRLLLLELLENSCVVQSWGINHINIYDNSIQFNVSGFKHKGSIQIVCNKSDYTILFNNTSIRCDSVKSVVKTLDELIECSFHYFDDIVDWINSMQL